MITPKVLEPETVNAEREALEEIATIIRQAHPSLYVEAALKRISEMLATLDSRPHRGLVDYDQRIHG